MRLVNLFLIFLTLFIIFNCDNSTIDSLSDNKPVLELIGEDTVYIDSGRVYVDSGCNAFDEDDGFLSDSIKTGYYKSDKISTIGKDELTNTVGVFYVRYSITDSDNNTEVIWRCIIVKAVIIVGKIPEFTLMGNDTVFADNDGSFIEPGYECIDEEDGDLTDSVKGIFYKSDKKTVLGNELLQNDSIYHFKYYVYDSDSNYAEAWRCLTLKDDFVEIGNVTPYHIDMYPNAVAYVTFEIEASDTLVVSENFTFSLENSNGQNSSDIDLSLSYSGHSTGEAIFTISPHANCPSDTYTVILTVTNKTVSASKSFTISVMEKINYNVSAIGLWIDTFPQMPPFLTTDLEISFELDTVTDSLFEITMKETDTNKERFIYNGTWREDSISVYLNGVSCYELEPTADTLIENADLIDTVIVIRKNIDTVAIPDSWDLVLNDMAFLIPALNMGVNNSIIGNVPIELKRSFKSIDTTSNIILSASANKTYLSSVGNVEVTAVTNENNPTFYYKLNNETEVSSNQNTYIFNLLSEGSHSLSVWAMNSTGVKSNVITISVFVGAYPLHNNINASSFWCGEGASSDNDFIINTVSAWDIHWGEKFGLEDHPTNISRDSDYIPTSSKFTGNENPYYFALPYNDFGRLVYDGINTQVDTAAIDGYGHKKNCYNTVYWANEQSTSGWATKSMCKNRWIRLRVSGSTNWCYAQWEDAGPYYYNDHNYVFGTSNPANTTDSPYAGIDLSPSVCLFLGQTLDTWGVTPFNVDWQFVNESEVPEGPWKKHVTTSQVDWQN